jgi:ACT domain-containing protein
MIMLTDIRGLSIEFSAFVDKLSALGASKNLVIHTMHEDIFNTMHHI